MPLALRYAISLIVVVLDQITKVAVDTRLNLYDYIPVTSFFNITLAYNKGAAFSFLSNAGGWQRYFFTAVSLIVSIVLIVWLFRMTRRERALSFAISLILGGAIGNLIDRVIYGHVVDFIQFHYAGWSFPSFNIADMAISCGTALLLIITLFDKPEQKPVTPQ